MIDQTQDHKAHLSFSERGWILIYQGSPLCDYKTTYKDVMKAVAQYRITLPDVTWNGDLGCWVITNTIEQVTA
jgi:hypothetical protein